MKTKFVKIQIDDEKFPELFNLKSEVIGNKCYEIFETGYKLSYPDSKILMENTTNNLQTELMKHEMNKLNGKLDNDELHEKISDFTDIVQNLFGINYNSTKKGKIGEDFVYALINNKFKDYTIDITRNKPHQGDGIIKIPNKPHVKIMLEIKNYMSNIDKDELDKLLYDMKYTNTYYSIFLSLKSSFVGKKRLEVNSFVIDGANYTVIFVPFALDDPNKIENAIVLAEHIIEMNLCNKNDIYNDKLYKNINSHLNEIDSIYTKLGELKSHYLKTESNIKQQISDHYKVIREYELHTKNTINKVWSRIQLDFDKYKKEKISAKYSDNILCSIDNAKNKSKLQNLRGFIELFNKYGIHIINNTCDIECDQCWSLIESSDDKTVGNISKNKGIIEINLTHPSIVNFIVTKDKPSFMNTVSILEKIFVQTAN